MNPIWTSKKSIQSCGKSANSNVRPPPSPPPSPLPSLSLTSSTTDVQAFVLVHLVTKLGTATNDAATSLKLLEKGLKKEDLALAVLIDFPFQILFGYLAAKWSKGEKPLRPVCSFFPFFLPILDKAFLLC